jgi:3-oxoacid CoA-transferase subunit B/3-oxoadipate CoA-transferase beta subunit
MGGAMDLVAGVKRVVVVMEHTEKSGAPKLVKACSLPLTGKACVDLVVTDLGVFEVNRGKSPLTLLELAPGVTLDEVKARTEPDVQVAKALAPCWRPETS